MLQLTHGSMGRCQNTFSAAAEIAPSARQTELRKTELLKSDDRTINEVLCFFDREAVMLVSVTPIQCGNGILNQRRLDQYWRWKLTPAHPSGVGNDKKRIYFQLTFRSEYMPILIISRKLAEPEGFLLALTYIGIILFFGNAQAIALLRTQNYFYILRSEF